MKLLLSISLAMLLGVSVMAQGQLKDSGVMTTTEEYNYLTQRLPNEDNAEMLEGYFFEDFLDKTFENYNYKYQLFKEVETGKVKAIFITITKFKKNDDKVRYLCMPINNKELFKQFEFERNGLGLTMYGYFEALNSVLVSKFVDEHFNSSQE